MSKIKKTGGAIARIQEAHEDDFLGMGKDAKKRRQEKHEMKMRERQMMIDKGIVRETAIGKIGDTIGKVAGAAAGLLGGAAGAGAEGEGAGAGEPKEEKSKTGLYVGIGVGVVLLIVVVMVIIKKRKKAA